MCPVYSSVVKTAAGTIYHVVRIQAHLCRPEHSKTYFIQLGNVKLKLVYFIHSAGCIFDLYAAL